jgi:hypothetical protein
MGKLTYGAIQREIVMDDNLLAHIEVVVLSRLRRNNAFALRWTETVEGSTDVRRTIWVHQGSDLYFEYETPTQGELDHQLLDKLAKSADSNAGINLRMDASDALWSAVD